MTRLRVGTKNPGKLREFAQMLAPLGIEVRGVDDLDGFDPVEDGDTFADNAIKKAVALMELTGEAAVADDSGLVVDALGGRPGVHSARYAGVEGPEQDAQNRRKLIEELRGVDDAARSARFVCALAYCVPGEEPRVFHGTFEGRIGHAEQGDNGFGYDSIFIVPEDGRTSAEISPEEKNALSHRGEALRALLAHLRAC